MHWGVSAWCVWPQTIEHDKRELDTTLSSSASHHQQLGGVLRWSSPAVIQWCHAVNKHGDLTPVRGEKMSTSVCFHSQETSEEETMIVREQKLLLTAPPAIWCHGRKRTRTGIRQYADSGPTSIPPQAEIPIMHYLMRLYWIGFALVLWPTSSAAGRLF